MASAGDPAGRTLAGGTEAVVPCADGGVAIGDGDAFLVIEGEPGAVLRWLRTRADEVA